MSSADTAKAIADALAATRAAQARAADPAASAWVSANAGTGKTYVLTRRVLRLLLAGTRPDRILCLTYTKAAAAEMARRVFDALAAFVLAEEETLARNLAELLGRPATEEEAERARTLFANTIETAGGLKILTIHAFAEQLLQRFPLEAGVAPSFRILDEAEGAGLMRAAVDEVLREASADPSGALGQALARAIVHAAGDGFDAVLGQALGDR